MPSRNAGAEAHHAPFVDTPGDPSLERARRLPHRRRITFDPRDRDHQRCVGLLSGLDEGLATTLPVFTEAFHLLGPESPAAQRLMDFVGEGGLTVWFLDDPGLVRAFELMRRYDDVPMDFADATLVAAAEAIRAQRVFTLERKDFDVYRVRRGHRHLPFAVLT